MSQCMKHGCGLELREQVIGWGKYEYLVCPCCQGEQATVQNNNNGREPDDNSIHFLYELWKDELPFLQQGKEKK